MSGLGRRVIVGAAWSAAGGAVLRLGNLFVGIVAARLLEPQDFGVFAVSMVVFTLIGQVAELGLHSALLRASNEEFDTVAPTAVTLAILSYSALGIGLVLLASPIASAFGTPEAVPALRVLAICVFLGAPASVPNAQLRREFRMGVQSGIEFVGFLISSGALVVLAVGGHGAMALAWSRVLGQIFVVALLQLAVPKRYAPGFRLMQARDILAVGLPLVGAILTGTVIAGANVFFIGRIAGAGEVGLFNMGDNISAWPIGLFLPILLNVGLPLFSKIRHTPAVVREVFTICIEGVVWGFWPVSLLLAAMAPYLVQILYGDKWLPAAAVVQVLAICKVGEIINRLCVDVAVAGAYTRRYLLVQFTWLFIQVPAVWCAASHFGVVGVVWTNLVVMVLAVVPMHLALVRPMIDGSIVSVFRRSAVPALAGGVAALAAGLAASWATPPSMALLVGALVGAASYLLMTFRWARTALARVGRLRDMTGWEVQA